MKLRIEVKGGNKKMNLRNVVVAREGVVILSTECGYEKITINVVNARDEKFTQLEITAEEARQLFNFLQAHVYEAGRKIIK